jgi:fluoride exporter
VHFRTGRKRAPADRDHPRSLPIDPDLDDGAAPARRPGPRPPQQPAHTQPAVLAAIAVGGALGASARYGLSRSWPSHGGGFPWATFWTNVSGSFVLGLFLVIVVERTRPHRLLRPFFATGFLGAYTTFSTFAVETDVLLRDGHAATAAGYAFASLAVGLAAAWLGMVGARRLPAR